MRCSRALPTILPSPDEAPAEVCEDEKGELIEINCTPNGSTVAMIFKTVADQYGRFSYFKVFSGTVKQEIDIRIGGCQREDGPYL